MGFLHKCWDIFKVDMMECFEEFLPMDKYQQGTQLHFHRSHPEIAAQHIKGFRPNKSHQQVIYNSI